MSKPLVLVKGGRSAFVPYFAQREILTSPAKIICATGGIGFGKTVSSVAWLLNEAWQYPGLYWCCAPTYGQLKGALWQSLLEMTPRYLVASVTKQPLEMVLINGSVIQGRNLSDPEQLLGPELGGIAIDQPEQLADYEALDVLMGRLRQAGTRRRIFLAANAKGKDWLYHLFSAPLSEIEDETLRKKASGIREFSRVFNITSYQNPFLYDDFAVHGTCNRSEYIERLEGSYTERARRRWLLGSTEDFSGDVYDAFDEDKNVIDMPTEWKGVVPSWLTLFQGVDFGTTDPFVSLLVGMDKRDKNNIRYYVLQEHYKANETLSNHAAAMVAQEGGRYVQYRFTDHEATIRSELQQRLRDAKATNAVCTPAYKGSIDIRIDLLNRLFLTGRLFILRGAAPKLVSELKTRDYVKKGDKMVAVDKANHSLDALDYVVNTVESKKLHSGSISVG